MKQRIDPDVFMQDDDELRHAVLCYCNFEDYPYLLNNYIIAEYFIEFLAEHFEYIDLDDDKLILLTSHPELLSEILDMIGADVYLSYHLPAKINNSDRYYICIEPSFDQD